VEGCLFSALNADPTPQFMIALFVCSIYPVMTLALLELHRRCKAFFPPLTAWVPDEPYPRPVPLPLTTSVVACLALHRTVSRH
jgi:hypothetical protein